MRDLGTPAYGRSFFLETLRALPDHTHLCVVRHQGEAVAASFLVGFRDRVEAVWSSSVRKALPLKPNMFLYWNLFCYAGQRGYRIFDFGRSTVDSGTHAFKMQWGGAQTVPLHWDYWLPGGDDLPELNPRNPKYRMAIWVWQKLPLGLTRMLGPNISKCLP
jgi:serine/alanine adding enzyme